MPLLKVRRSATLVATSLLVFLLGSITSALGAKPTGMYSASGATNPSVQSHPAVRGVLIRADWAELEPAPGLFDFDRVALQANAATAAGLEWSLAVSGSDHPAWLRDLFGAESFTILFRGEPKIIPKWWDPIVRERLACLAAGLAAEFGSDPLLSLVYVPQMSANGIEGHFNGVPAATLTAAGYTEDLWVESALITARDFAWAFPDKALAFEVHELLASTAPAERILNELWTDGSLQHRVGGAVWWLSGRTDYQADLLDFLTQYTGDLYCQLIASSAEPARFLGNDLVTALDQAMDLGARYVEGWEYDFENHTHDQDFADFNLYADNLVAPTAVGAPELAGSFSVSNEPNPFNARMTIRFSLKQSGPVKLVVYDLRGKLVKTLFDGESPAGENVVSWNGADQAGEPVASGVYVYVFSAAGGVAKGNMVLVK